MSYKTAAKARVSFNVNNRYTKVVIYKTNKHEKSDRTTQKRDPGDDHVFTLSSGLFCMYSCNVIPVANSAVRKLQRNEFVCRDK